MSGISAASADPHGKRWMLFVDGENFTIRSKKLAKKKNVELRKGEFYEPDVFVWIPNQKATVLLPNVGLNLQSQAVRSYYYTNVKGDNANINKVRESLWNLGFHPEVFKKDRPDQKAKGVDITLTKDMLSHAYLDNYDVAVLLSGDGDYVPLLNEVKRLGKQVCVAFFTGDFGLIKELKLASDSFANIQKEFVRRWQEFGT